MPPHPEAAVGVPATDEGKSRLIAAAIAAFAAKGFHGTTTRDIAAAAGMSPAALYVHYKSKEDLLYVISKAGHDRILDLVQTALTGPGDPATQLANLMRAFTIDHAHGHTVARIVNYELAALAPAHLAEIAAIRRTTTDLLRTFLSNGVQSGAFTTPNPSMTALALLSLGIDVARWYREQAPWTPTDIATHYAHLALKMVGAS